MKDALKKSGAKVDAKLAAASKGMGIKLAPEAQPAGKNKTPPVTKEDNKKKSAANPYFLAVHETWILWLKDVGSAVGLIILLHFILNSMLQNIQEFGFKIYLLRTLSEDQNGEDPQAIGWPICLRYTEAYKTEE